MIRVKATREGLVGQRTASGYVIDTVVSFVALPSAHALKRWVKVSNPLTQRTVYAQVLDVGPHSDDDDAYVFNGHRPLSEAGISRVKGKQYKAGNTAGIDLGEAVWVALGMKDNTAVDWEFLLL